MLARLASADRASMGPWGQTIGVGPALTCLRSISCVQTGGFLFVRMRDGLRFVGGCGRLLIGVDWMPLNLIVTQEEHAITDYLRCCELTPPLTESST